MVSHPRRKRIHSHRHENAICPVSTRVSQMKTLNMFDLVIYCTQKVHNDFIFRCSIVLPPVGHSLNHEYHCWNLHDNRAVVRIFIALLMFSVDSPSYILNWQAALLQSLSTLISHTDRNYGYKAEYTPSLHMYCGNWNCTKLSSKILRTASETGGTLIWN